MGRVAAMRCVCCRLLSMKQEGRTYCHHIREEREARNDFLTLPLCWSCHQGGNGVHGTKAYLRMLKLSEWGLLAHVIEEFDECLPDRRPSLVIDRPVYVLHRPNPRDSRCELLVISS